MDSVELDHDEDYIEDISGDHIVSLDSSGINNVNEDQPVLPRIGAEYQVELPQLESEINAGDMSNIDYYGRMGLVVPITWIPNQIDDIKHETQESPRATGLGEMPGLVDLGNEEGSWTKSKSSRLSGFDSVMSNNNGTFLHTSVLKTDCFDHKSDHDKGFARSTSHESTTRSDQLDVGFPWVQQRKYNYSPIPGSSVTFWNDAETESFLLGLYIFGKSLVQVKKFMESKGMGDILSYYYGRFYRSDAHRRWSECKKIRSRKCVHGQRIFTGWRQQELLSRLLPSSSETSKNALLEATKAFNEGRTSLEEYVFAIKATISMKVLVEAVGIGKDKRDLTGIVMDPSRTSQVLPIRPEIPVGKACSFLTSGDIIKFLTGDFRLSKTRSNDLFWEAVWPRLLARGWHSEQPKNHGYVSSKHALVFIIPGIKKFSRRKLVKGDHYFDSVSDVLNRVAQEPRLLELEVEGSKGSSSIQDDSVWDVNNKLEDNGASDHQRHCYLRPRLPNCNSELMKFTVVDTSLVQGEAPFKIRELRSLPVDNTCNYGSPSPSGETESDSSKEQKNSADMPIDDQGDSDPVVSGRRELGGHMSISGKGMQSDLPDHVVRVSKRRVPINRQNSDGPHCCVLNNEYAVKDTKGQFSYRVKSGKPSYLSPVPKRRRLAPCDHPESGHRSYSLSLSNRSRKEEVNCQSKSLKAGSAMDSEVGLSLCKISSSSSAKSSPDDSSEFILSVNCSNASTVNETVLYNEQLQPRALIDLNLRPPDFESSEPCSAEVPDSRDKASINLDSVPSETKQNCEDSQVLGTSNDLPAEQQQTVNARRQSTRNRPLTTRALEALASGFLTTRRRGRSMKAPISGGTASRSSQNACKTNEDMVTISNVDHGNAVSEFSGTKFEAVDEERISSTNHMKMLTMSQAGSERKESTHGLPDVP